MSLRNFGSKLATGLSALALVSCFGSGDHAGIEVGNPTLTVSAEFELADGDPTYVPLAKTSLVAVASSEVSWQSLGLPLREVRYYASYYYYLPTDPAEGSQLWPENGDDTLLAMNVLKGDTLVANFANMDIPSRSYLKEVGLNFHLSQWTFDGTWCASASTCRKIRIQFPDSSEVDVRFHHSQLVQELDTGKLRLPVLFHPQVLLSNIDLVALSDSLPTDSVLLIQGDSSLVRDFARSFSGLSYSYHIGAVDSGSGILPAALAAYDIPGVDRVLNGNFALQGADWIFLTQAGGAADTSFEPGSVRFDVTKGGTEDYSIQWMQEDIELIKNRWYLLRFTASSSDDSTFLLARVGRYHAPYDNLDTGNEDWLVQLGPTEKTVEYEFSAKETTPFGRLEFNLGNFDSRKVWIKDVSLIQLAE